MRKIRKSLIVILFLLCGFVYYLLFFTRVFNAGLRELAYILSGHSIEAVKSISESHNTIMVIGEKAYPLYDAFSSTLVSHLQYGPYMNLTVYMISLFSVVPLFLIAQLLKKYHTIIHIEEEKQQLKSFVKKFLNYLVFMFIISGVGSMLSAILAAVFLKSSPTSANQAAIQNNLKANFIITLIPIVILAPIVEEVVFRGVLLSGIKRILELRSSWKTKSMKISQKHAISLTYAELGSLLFSSTLFAIIHLSTNFNQWVYFPVYFCGGITLGGIYIVNRERIYSSMFIHSAYNAIPVLMIAIIHLLGGR